MTVLDAGRLHQKMKSQGDLHCDKYIQDYVGLRILLMTKEANKLFRKHVEEVLVDSNKTDFVKDLKRAASRVDRLWLDFLRRMEGVKTFFSREYIGVKSNGVNPKALFFSSLKKNIHRIALVPAILWSYYKIRNYSEETLNDKLDLAKALHRLFMPGEETETIVSFGVLDSKEKLSRLDLMLGYYYGTKYQIFDDLGFSGEEALLFLTDKFLERERRFVQSKYYEQKTKSHNESVFAANQICHEEKKKQLDPSYQPDYELKFEMIGSYVKVIEGTRIAKESLFLQPGEDLGDLEHVSGPTQRPELIFRSIRIDYMEKRALLFGLHKMLSSLRPKTKLSFDLFSKEERVRNAPFYQYQKLHFDNLYEKVSCFLTSERINRSRQMKAVVLEALFLKTVHKKMKELRDKTGVIVSINEKYKAPFTPQDAITADVFKYYFMDLQVRLARYLAEGMKIDERIFPPLANNISVNWTWKDEWIYEGQKVEHKKIAFRESFEEFAKTALSFWSDPRDGEEFVSWDEQVDELSKYYSHVQRILTLFAKTPRPLLGGESVSVEKIVEVIASSYSNINVDGKPYEFLGFTEEQILTWLGKKSKVIPPGELHYRKLFSFMKEDLTDLKQPLDFFVEELIQENETKNLFWNTLSDDKSKDELSPDYFEAYKRHLNEHASMPPLALKVPHTVFAIAAEGYKSNVELVLKRLKNLLCAVDDGSAEKEFTRRGLDIKTMRIRFGHGDRPYTGLLSQDARAKAMRKLEGSYMNELRSITEKIPGGDRLLPTGFENCPQPKEDDAA